MHRALRILEIVEAVCAHLPPYSSPSARSTLYSIALVCRFFSGPALDVLWSTQYSLVNILPCLPVGLWEIVRFENPKPSMRAQRAMNSVDWTRFNIYARRVRTLVITDNGSEADILSAIFKMLSLSNTSQETLFPKLRRLHWQMARRPWLSYVPLFLSSSLESISLVTVITSYAHLALLAVVPTLCPLLTRVEICISGRLAHPAKSVILSKLKHVNHLSIEGISESDLAHLAHLPSLTSLSVKQPSDSIHNHSFESVARQTTPFTSLQELTLDHDSIPFVVGLLGMKHGWSLRRLSYTTRNAPLAADTAKVFAVLKAKCTHSSLTHIRYSISRTNILLYPNDGVIEQDTLRLLFVFRSLREVVLHPGSGFDLDDSDIDALARAWPQLYILHLHGSGFRCPASRVTLRGLHSLAKHCHSLIDLKISLDASVVFCPEDDTGIDVARSKAPLQKLSVEDSIITEAAPVVAYLLRIFPSITLVTTMARQFVLPQREFQQQCRMYDLWNQVHKMLAQIHSPPPTESSIKS
ncbi:hypothetical protein R3P38DRAFT_3231715 [Favolaschia claudopus]|uniref:F-box domain-containing protein n=1 Tax=Favolaschia claudopus TaxID=2862362 RepID=A0AAV9ZJS2_9AGAR